LLKRANNILGEIVVEGIIDQITEMAKDIGMHVRMVFNWKAKEPNPTIKAIYLQILQ